MSTQQSRAKIFKAFHDRPQPLLLPNPWDAGSAKLFADMGFEALANADSVLENL